jgi:WD40 repeat protein
MLVLRSLSLALVLCLVPALLADEVLPKGAAVRIGSTHWRVPDSYDFAISADSKLIAVPVGPSEVRFWDAVTGETRKVLTGPPPGNGIALTPDGKQVLVKEDFDRLRLWDIATSKSGKEFVRKNDIIGLTMIAPDGKWLAAISGDSGKLKNVTAWGLASGRAFFTGQGDPKTITGMAIAPDSGVLATVGSDGTIILWDPTDGSEVARFIGPREPFIRSGLAFTPDGKTLVSAVGVEVVRWDVAAKKEESRFKLAVGPATVSPDGKWVAIVTQGKMELWDTKSQKQAKVFGTNITSTGQVRFAPDGSFIALLTNSGLMRIWDTSTGVERSSRGGHIGPIQSLHFLPDSKTLLSASADGTARLWDATSGKEVRLIGPGGRATASSDGKVIAVGGEFGNIGFFETESGKQLATVKDAGQSFAFAPDGKTLASLSGRRAEAKVRQWTTDGKEAGEFAAPQEGPRTLLAAPDGKRFAIGDTTVGNVNEQHTVLFDPATGKKQNTVEGRPFAFSADSKSLLTADRDGLLIWDTSKGTKVRAIPLKGLQPLAGTWSPNGKMLAVSQGASVVLWDAQEGKEVARLVGHENSIEALAFSPDGKWLASGSKDTTILLWDMSRIGK